MTQTPPNSDRPTPAEEARRLYDETEARTAKAFDELVSRPAFGEVLARVTENVVALTRIGNDAADLVLRNLRLAGRQDLLRVGRQIARTEDKLEMVLQEVERLRADMTEGGENGRLEERGGRSGRSGPADDNSTAAASRQGTEA